MRLARFTAAVPLVATTLLAPSLAPPAAAQAVSLAHSGYQTPPPEIGDAVLAPRHENVEPEDPSPDGRFLIVEVEDRPLTPLALLAKRHYNLGGLQIDPATNRRRYLTSDAPDGYRLISASDGREIEVDAPDGAKVSAAAWSPDGGRLAFLAHLDDGSYVYVADPESGDARRLTDSPVLATLVTSLEWSGDGRHVFTVLVPEDRGAEPAEPAVATTPHIWLTRDEENELRTYPSLLETPYEFALLEHYTTGQLARIEVESGDVDRIGEPAMIDGIDPSPDGRYVRVERIREPFSDIVPVYAFATVDEVWDLDGEAVARLADEPADEGADDDEDEDDDGRRRIAWRPDGRGLSFLQREPAPDGEDADSTSDESEEDEAERPERADRVMQWLPPFDSGAATVVYESENTIDRVRYSDDARTLFITEEDGSEEHLYAVSLDDPDTRHTIYRWDEDDFYENPGNLVMRTGSSGEPVVRVSADGRHVYLSGTQYHEDPLANAPQPFLDRVAIETGEKTRIFESAADRYEDVEAVLGDGASRLLISRQSRTEVPNYFVVATGGGETRVTDNRDYTPDITRAQRHMVEVERADGVTFWVEVTLPEDYQPGTRLPAIFWHYPSEYESEEDYDEDNRDYNKNDFPGIGARSIEILLRRGWAVVSPDVPIIGPSRDRWNDYYVLHLRNSLAAAIDALDERGWIDRDRLAIGGHSYGGFGTLNALIRTPFFKAGLAGAANSNRTLTPAGFQREPRTLWEGRETYTRMSPIFWMNEMSGALLLYHGIEDQNVGTFPVHSWRSFHALNALGKTAALYMYPYEAHGPRARETVLDLWSRWVAWLDTHVLGRGEPETETVAEEATTGSRD